MGLRVAGLCTLEGLYDIYYLSAPSVLVSTSCWPVRKLLFENIKRSPASTDGEP